MIPRDFWDHWTEICTQIGPSRHLILAVSKIKYIHLIFLPCLFPSNLSSTFKLLLAWCLHYGWQIKNSFIKAIFRPSYWQLWLSISLVKIRSCYPYIIRSCCRTTQINKIFFYLQAKSRNLFTPIWKHLVSSIIVPHLGHVSASHTNMSNTLDKLERSLAILFIFNFRMNNDLHHFFNKLNWMPFSYLCL